MSGYFQLVKAILVYFPDHDPTDIILRIEQLKIQSFVRCHGQWMLGRRTNHKIMEVRQIIINRENNTKLYERI